MHSAIELLEEIRANSGERICDGLNKEDEKIRDTSEDFPAIQGAGLSAIGGKFGLTEDERLELDAEMKDASE